MIFGLPSDNFGADFVSFWMRFTVTVNFFTVLCVVWAQFVAVLGEFWFGVVRSVVTTHKTKEGG